VLIGGEDESIVFDWEPEVLAGAAHGQGRRGTDRRLEGR
jgi:GTP-binding protein